MDYKEKYSSFSLQQEILDGKPTYKLYGYKKVSVEEMQSIFMNQKRSESKQSPLLEFIKEFASFEEAQNFSKENLE